jgi:LysM repeat protein
MVSNCDKLYKVKKGDNCESIAKKNGISTKQFTTWNEKIGGAACSGLWLDTFVCVSMIGHQPTPTQPGNGVSTPTPIQGGMTKKCKKVHFIAKGQNCDTITKKYKISMKQFKAWNPAPGKGCKGLWAKTYCCVAVL